VLDYSLITLQYANTLLSASPSSSFLALRRIELYNSQSMDIQIIFPSIVKGIETGPAGGYRVTKTTDGKEVRHIDEKYLHHYKPYPNESEVLCNIGESRGVRGRPVIVRCTVLGYEPAATRGAMILQGTYEVQVHETKANEEYTTTLPVWKLQRRYLVSLPNV